MLNNYENDVCQLMYIITVLSFKRCSLDIRIMQNEVFLSQVLTEMKKLDENKNPIPFTILIRTFNEQNKSGGKLILYENAMLMQPPKVKGQKRLLQGIEFKNPNHWENRTRNIKTNEGIKKIHILFIIKFNGLDVNL